GNVVNPAVGTSFDSLDEAYQFYNLYSWEVGFGIRYSKSWLNVERVKCMQEIVCGCAVRFLIFLSVSKKHEYYAIET
uniref:FAR1 domain-containing protein n=1 Tax=Aegilops tauschii subsp. strangulata TaxID=200361 RepID=A0A453PGJ8_AEGTS